MVWFLFDMPRVHFERYPPYEPVLRKPKMPRRNLITVFNIVGLPHRPHSIPMSHPDCRSSTGDIKERRTTVTNLSAGKSVSNSMKAAAVLAILNMVVGVPAQAAPDWTKLCAEAGHFAALVAAARDEGHSATEATARVRQILVLSSVSTPAVADEITRQVYTQSTWNVEQAEKAIRAKCLTPPAPPPRQIPVSSRPAISGLTPIKLNVGVNTVEHATADDSALQITLAWKNDGHGRGHDAFVAVVPGAGTVAMPDGDELVDDPAGDLDMRRSVRFARGQVNGADALLLLTATREPDGQTVYRVHLLVLNETGYQFAPLLEQKLASHYCNADIALSAASGLPLRASYRGLNSATGCPGGGNQQLRGEQALLPGKLVTSSR